MPECVQARREEVGDRFVGGDEQQEEGGGQLPFVEAGGVGVRDHPADRVGPGSAPPEVHEVVQQLAHGLAVGRVLLAVRRPGRVEQR